MYNSHPAAEALKALMASPAAEPKKPVAAAPVLDSVEPDDGSPASNYASTDVALKAAAAVQEWVETDDLEPGETLADRLFAMLVGIADADMDGEIGEDEAGVFEMAANAAWDYLDSKGVPEDDISALLNDFDTVAADRVQELLAERLPDGEEADAEIDAFAFGDGSDEAVMDAVYKKKIVVRGGKKVRVNKRISGTVRLTAKQKMAVKKMLRKTHSAMAQMRRAKSMRVRRKMSV